MDESEKAAIDAVQAEKTELGIPADVVETAEVEETPIVETAPEAKPKEDEDPEDPEEVSNRVPTFKDFKEYKKTLREEMQSDFDGKLEKMREEMAKAKPDEDATLNLEDDVKALADKLELDPVKTKAIIEMARKGLEPLTAEDKALLEDYKKDKETRVEEAAKREQEEIFRTEWDALTPSLKKQFPNATDEQLKAAKDKMDELSHTEKYNLTDLDYVLFKEQKEFGKILFSPKQATFESARPVNFDESDEFPEFNPNMTPAQFAAFEKGRERAMDTMGPEKVRITTRDDRGNIVEREE